MSEDGTFDVLPKKEVIAAEERVGEAGEEPWRYQGYARSIPDAIFVVDPKKEKNLCTGSSHSGYSADRYR